MNQKAAERKNSDIGKAAFWLWFADNLRKSLYQGAEYFVPLHPKPFSCNTVPVVGIGLHNLLPLLSLL